MVMPFQSVHYLQINHFTQTKAPFTLQAETTVILPLCDLYLIFSWQSERHRSDLFKCDPGHLGMWYPIFWNTTSIWTARSHISDPHRTSLHAPVASQYTLKLQRVSALLWAAADLSLPQSCAWTRSINDSAWTRSYRPRLLYDEHYCEHVHSGVCERALSVSL